MPSWLELAAGITLLGIAACDAGPSAPDAAQAEPSALYAEVTAIIERSCAYQRCHAGPIVGGGLDLSRGSDLHGALVSVPACEYERMRLVEPGHPEQSWLMVKLTASYRPASDPYPNYIHFKPAADWDPTVRACRDQTEDGTPLFGQRMPNTAPNTLSDAELDAIRRWIAAGAPR